MILKQQVEEVVSQALLPNQYLVEVQVKPGNKIVVFFDSVAGVGIDDCVVVARAIEAAFDREVEDYELEVSSPGISLPFRVPQQYNKYTGKEVQIVLTTGIKYNGVITNATETAFEAEVEIIVKAEKGNKKQKVKELLSFEYAKVKSTKLKLVF